MKKIKMHFHLHSLLSIRLLTSEMRGKFNASFFYKETKK